MFSYKTYQKKVLKNYTHIFHCLFREQRAAMNSKDIHYTLEDLAIFSSDILGLSDDSDKEELNNPLKSGNVLCDTDTSA